ncbi:MAG: hypothetical protein Q9212_002615 [Teloschistes hypoglaucus]
MEEATSTSHVSDSSSRNASEDAAKDLSAQHDVTRFETPPQGNDSDWMDLVHWDEDYVGQQTLSEDDRDERDTANEDDSKIHFAEQLEYTMDDLLEDAQRFVNEGRLDLDGLNTDLIDLERPTETPVPRTEQGRSSTDEIHEILVDNASKSRSDQEEEEVVLSPRTRHMHRPFLIKSYDGIRSIIQRLSNYSLDHKSDIMNAFRLSAYSRCSTRASYDIVDTRAGFDIAKARVGNEAFKSKRHGENTWNPFDRPAAMDHSFTSMSFKDITTVITRATRDSFLTEQSTDGFESLRSNDGTDRFGNTLLHLAASHSANYTILNALITKANVHRVDSCGQTFMHLVHPRAIGSKMELDVDEYDCNGETELLKASRENDPSLSQDYYENLNANGVNVHYRNIENATPLLLAVVNGNVTATRVLLRYHSNVHARDDLGRGILRRAEIARRKWPGRYASIIACEALVIDAGAVNFPTVFDEWEFEAENVF